MTNKGGSAWLAEEISQLEQKELMQRELLKSQLHQTVESLKPSSLVKSAFNSITSAKNFKSNVLDTSLGIGAGLLAKKWYLGASRNIFKKLAGFVLQNITTGLVTKKMPGIREKISSLRTK